jgi:uncharacterized Tic20 family protein
MNDAATENEQKPSQSGKFWSIERQVRFTSAVLVLIGIGLAYTVNANWICLSAFIALGMIVSAITDTCGMGVVLSQLPWNIACSTKCSTKRTNS